MYSDASHALVSGPISDSRNSPNAVTSEPTIGKIRYRPVLLTTLPLKIDAAQQPDHHRQRAHAGDGRRVAVDVLQEGRQEHHRAEHGEARR